jgi:hypothetical protein
MAISLALVLVLPAEHATNNASVSVHNVRTQKAPLQHLPGKA